ncbi:MAG: hypothetical protein IJJ74_02275 [Eubacterium sp.]|nr:hypothetical protein [Eubacterium sp.]
MSREEVKEKVEKGEKNSNKLIIEIVSCVIAIIAIIVAMIFVLKSKEKSNTMTHLEEKAATVFDSGNIECWYDVAKDKYYSDKKGRNEIAVDSVFTYVFDKNTEGLVKYDGDGKFYYVKEGVCDKGFSEFVKEDNDWFYIKNGQLDEKLESVVKGTVYGEEAWWYVKDGKVSFIDTVAQNESGWWNIVKGKVEFKDAIGTNDTGSWYCKGGKVDFEFNGEIEFGKKIYEIQGGKVVNSKDDPKYAGKVEYYADKSADNNIITSKNETVLIDGFKYFEGKTGARPYLYVMEVLPSENIDAFLEDLSNDIFGNNDGIIIVYVKFEDMFWIYTREDGSSIGLKDKTLINESIRANWAESDIAARFGKALTEAANKLAPMADENGENTNDGGGSEEGSDKSSEE